MKKTAVTNEDLAGLIDSLAVMTATRFDKHETILNFMELEFKGMRTDIRDINNTLKSVTHLVGSHDSEIQKLDVRVSRLESKKNK